MLPILLEKAYFMDEIFGMSSVRGDCNCKDCPCNGVSWTLSLPCDLCLFDHLVSFFIVYLAWFSQNKVWRFRSFSLLWMFRNVIHDSSKKPISISHVDVSSKMLPTKIATSSCLCQLLMKLLLFLLHASSCSLGFSRKRFWSYPQRVGGTCWRSSHIAHVNRRLQTWSTCRLFRCVFILILASRSLLFQSLN